MFESLSLPTAAKVCAAVAVAGGVSVGGYQVVVADSTESTVVADAPSELAFADADGIPEEEPVKKVEEVHAEDGQVEDDDVEHKSDSDVDEKSDDDHKEEDAKDDDEGVVADLDTETHVEILWPENDTHKDDAKIVFEGSSEPGSKVHAGPYAADVDAEGNWRIELILSPGANRTTIKAEDPAGNVAEDSVTVWLDVEEVEKVEEKDNDEEKDKDEEKDEVVNVEFSANNQFGSCGEEIPYDVYWGTATPNTVLTITSPYGDAVVEVGEKGHWEKKVYFETAPRGELFLVSVVAENGSKNFEFVAIAHEETDSANDESEEK